MLTQQLCYSLILHMGYNVLVHFDYPSYYWYSLAYRFFAHSLFNSVPAGLFRQISKQVSLVLRPMFQVSVSSVMNFSYQLSLYTSDVNLQVSLLRCIRHSVDGFEQVSSVDCSGIKGVNFQCLLDCVIRYRNKCFWCCDRCSRSQYRHADIQEIITIVGTIFSQVLM
ncbi:uncharacterized protein [Dysidea avara]|uniref:uncharacterized protein isoform X1 n=2 Tax=Dysidea avara TaxID=196820 RepID=UPI0033296D97